MHPQYVERSEGTLASNDNDGSCEKLACILALPPPCTPHAHLLCPFDRDGFVRCASLNIIYL